MNDSAQLIERLKIQLARMINKTEKLSRRAGDAPWLTEFVETQKGALKRLEEHVQSGGADALAGPLKARREAKLKAREAGGGKGKKAGKSAADKPAGGADSKED